MKIKIYVKGKKGCGKSCILNYLKWSLQQAGNEIKKERFFYGDRPTPWHTLSLEIDDLEE